MLRKKWFSPRASAFIAPALLALVFFSSSCLPDREEEPVLRLGYIPSDQTHADRREAFQALQDYLAQQTGVAVELVRTNSYQPAIAAMKRGEIDIMNFGAQAYLIAEQEAAAEAFALRGDENGNPHVYRSLLITSSASPLATIEDLVPKSRNLHVLFTNEASTSGYLIAKGFFSKQGLEPESSFARVAFSKSHALSVLEVSNGNADIASVSSNTLETLLRDGKVDRDSVRVLWSSNSIPNGPVAFRATLDEKLKNSIRKAYFELPKNDPKTWEKLKSLYPDEPFIYIPAHSGAFDTLREIRGSNTSGETAR